MIPKRYITQWLSKAPWPSLSQVEQDLIVSRAIIAIFNSPLLKTHLVFRGGTALNKLFFNPSLRYSEDIDLVQYKPGAIGDLMTEIRQVLDPWLGIAKYKQGKGRVTFFYRFETENAPIKMMKIKVEINTREHGSVLDLIEKPFAIKNGWFSGETSVHTYALEELIATKLRALYQRRKGRDLFDLYHVLLKYPKLNIDDVIYGFMSYLNQESLSVSRAEFEENMFQKIQNRLFEGDILPLLPPDIAYNQSQAYVLVHKEIISKIPGEPWEGLKE